MTDVASLGEWGVWPLGDLPGVCVRRALPLLGPVALGPRVLTSRLPRSESIVPGTLLTLHSINTCVLAALMAMHPFTVLLNTFHTSDWGVR